MKVYVWSFYILIGILFFASCKKDETPTDQPIGPSVSMDVGPEGGVIEFNDIYIDIPSGAWTENRKIEVFELQERPEAFDDVVTKNFRIDGLPAVINKEIHIELATSMPIESDQVVIEYELFKKGLNDVDLGHRFLPTEISEGRLTARIPVLDALSNVASDQEIDSRGGESHWFNIFAVSLVSSVESKNGHFVIRIPTASVHEAEYLGDYLEEAYDQFKDMGFDYSKRTQWPVEVIVKKLKNKDRFGAYAGSVYGFDAANIEFNITKLSDKEELRVTTGHEFFHLVQDLYDSRSTWQKAKQESALLGNGAPQMWLDEAMAVWAENFFTSKTRFAPLLFVENFPALLEGGYQAYGNKEQKQNYGYSLAPLIEFIHFHYGGDAALVNIYEEIKNKKEGMEIIDNLFLTSLHANWPFIVENVLEFQLYPAQEATSYDYVSLLPGLAQSRVLLAEQPQASKVFDFSLTGLSGKAFSIKNNNFTGFDTNSALTFEIMNEADVIIQVYRTHGEKGESEKIAQSTESVSISDFAEHIKNGYKIGAVVLKKGNDIPFTQDNENVSMKISIAQPFQYRVIEGGIGVNGIFKIEEKDFIWEVDTIYTENKSSGIGTLPIGYMNNFDFTTTLSGNTFTTTATGEMSCFGCGVWEHEYIILSTFDDVAEPSRLKSLEYRQHSIRRDTYNGTGEVETITAYFKIKDVPFDYFHPLQLCYIFKGDLSPQQIDMIEFKNEIIHYIRGDVDSRFYYKKELMSYDDGFCSVKYYKP